MGHPIIRDEIDEGQPPAPTIQRDNEFDVEEALDPQAIVDIGVATIIRMLFPNFRGELAVLDGREHPSCQGEELREPPRIVGTLSKGVESPSRLLREHHKQGVHPASEIAQMEWMGSPLTWRSSSIVGRGRADASRRLAW